ncbi:MAG: lysylphosphatidylglycerol synthase transmembrane domain-containing protein [Mycobacterium sp.]
MRVDGRDVSVSGSLLQPLTRRTNDILRLAASIVLLIAVVTSSLITRPQWEALEKSISQIVGVLSPKQSDLVYLVYGVAILALPFMILIGLIIARQWKLLGAYAAAALLALLPLSLGVSGFSAPRWHFDLSDRLRTVLAQFLDDPRWIAMLAAVLTVSGPWLPARWRHWWWALLLAFVPIHLVLSAIVPARALLGLAVGWVVGSLVVLVVGTPALEVPLEAAVRAMAKRGFVVSRLTVVRPAGRGPLVLSGECDNPDCPVMIELYGPHQRGGGALRQVWGKLRLRDAETAPLVASMRRAVEHRALMAIAIGELDLANTSTIAVAPLSRGWMLYSHRPRRGKPIDECAETTPVARLWESLHVLNGHLISHGDLRSQEITVEDGAVLFGDFFSAEYGANDAQLQSDIAQMLVTTSALYDPKAAVAAAIDAFGKDTILDASRRLTKIAVPRSIRKSVANPGAVISAARAEVKRQTGADQIKTETITRFTRSQVIQLVLFGALVYVAYPFISTVPTFISQLRHANWWWALLGLAVSALTYVGAAAALWACADGMVSFSKLSIVQVANTFAATTTPAGVGGLALSTRFLQKGGLTAMRATAAVALQQSVQVIVHLALLVFFSAVAGASTDLSHFVPSATMLYLIAGVALGIVGTFLFVPTLRRWLATEVRPKLAEVTSDLLKLAREPKRLTMILIGCAGTTLGAALALWASVEAFGGDTAFVTVTVVTMVGGTLASAAPTPGGVGAVEAALIGGLAAFGVPAAVGVPSVLLYRILTCWLPVFVGWRVMRWLTKNEMI